MGFLLAVALGVAGKVTAQNNGCSEYGGIVIVGIGVDEVILDRDVILLCPLYQAGLEVLFGLDQIVEIEVSFDEPLDDEVAASLVPLVKIDGTDERLEGVATDVTVV